MPLAELVAEQQLEAGVGGLERVAARLHVLDPLGDPADGVLVAGQVVAELAALQLHRRAARHVRHQHPHVVADQRGVDVLVQHGIHLHRRSVQPCLVRERGVPDVGLVAARRHVGDLADRVRDAAHLGQAPGRQHLPALLQLQPGHHAEQVGVARPLAVAVRGALHVAHAGVHGGERAGHPARGVVVAVNAQPGGRSAQYLGDDIGKLAGEHAAVGVTQGHHVGARLGRGAHHFEGVAGIGRVPVEEMLGVQEDPFPFRTEVGDRVGDHGEVLPQGRAQRQSDVPVVTLRDQRHDRRARLAQRGDLGVIGRPGAGPAGRAERDGLRVPEIQLAGGEPEELGVPGDRARPAALDEPDPELVQPGRDGQLVGDRQVQALLLGAVPQRGVVDVERVVGHRMSFPQSKRPLAACERSARRPGSAMCRRACR